VAGKAFDRVAPILVGDMIKLFGLTDVQAAGYVGNFGHESGLVSGQQEGWAIGKVCPREDLLKHKGGIDWPQWTGLREGGRRKNFVDFINSRRLPYPTYLASLAFLRHELEGDYAHSLRQVKKTTTLQAAVETAEATYEKAGVKNMSSRLFFAKRALDLYRASPPVPTPLPHPEPTPVPPIPMPVPLPDPKSPVYSKTNILAILMPVFTYLSTVGLKFPAETQDLIATGVTGFLGMLIAYFHSTASQPVSTSPLAKDVEVAKKALETQSTELTQQRADQGTYEPSPYPQGEVDDASWAPVPSSSSFAVDEDGNIDLTKLTVAQLTSIKQQLPAVLEPLMQRSLPPPEPRMPRVDDAPRFGGE
jgi:hypothetical protein